MNCSESEKRSMISDHMDMLTLRRSAVDDEITALKVLDCFGVEKAFEFMEKQKEKKK